MSNDEFCTLQLKTTSAKEALEWIKESTKTDDRTIGELNKQDSLFLVEELYELGAKQVIATDIKCSGFSFPPEISEIEETDASGIETTDVLIVELPENGNSRKDLFEWENEHAQSKGFDGVKDEGQKFILLFWG